jgi:hypothetical protein
MKRQCDRTLGHAILMTPKLLSTLGTTTVGSGAGGGGGGGGSAVVEVCPTSNLRTLELGGDITRHPTLRHWLEQLALPAPVLVETGDTAQEDVSGGRCHCGDRRVALAICTDDTALFAITVRARWGHLSALSIFLCKSVFYDAFVWARTALNSQKRRFPARAALRRARRCRGWVRTQRPGAGGVSAGAARLRVCIGAPQAGGSRGFLTPT